MAPRSNLMAAQRELDVTLAALAEAGSAERPHLECRVAGLLDRALTIRANDLTDLEVRLRAIRVLVVGMGEPGLLLNLVDAAIADVEGLKART